MSTFPALSSCLLSFFLLALPGPAEASAQDVSETLQVGEGRPPIQYHVVVREPLQSMDVPTLHVTADLILRGGRLKMSPAGPLPERWPTFVELLDVRTADGAPLTVTPSPSATPGWTVDAPDQPVRLRYRVRLDHEQLEWPGGIDGVAFVRDWGALLTGRAIFVTSPGPEARGEDERDEGRANLTVRFSVPVGWDVTTPWDPTGVANTWRVGSSEALTEAIILIGTHTERVIESGPITLRFAVAGEQSAELAAAYTARAGQILDYYTALIGGPPAPSPRSPLSTVVVAMTEADAPDGEVIGHHISLMVDPDGGPEAETMGWLIFAHEIFHLWNGTTLRVGSTRADWFKEGVTNYYTLKALHRVGVLPEPAVLSVVDGLFHARYRADPGYGTLSMREAASGFEKDDHWGLVYGGGLFAGLCIDLRIRHETGNARSLDDLMRAFYSRLGGTEQSFTTDDVLEAASALSGYDFGPFFATHITGAVPLPVAECLSLTSLDVDTQDGHLVAIQDPEATSLQVSLWEGLLGR